MSLQLLVYGYELSPPWDPDPDPGVPLIILIFMDCFLKTRKLKTTNTGSF
jgi:hypothetical protein